MNQKQTVTNVEAAVSNPFQAVPMPAWTSHAVRALAVVGLCHMLAACRMGPDYTRPETNVPASWIHGAASPENAANLGWWDFYGDPVLTNLIATALENNKDLRVAAARVEQALSGYRAQRSFLLPTLNASAAFTRARVGDLPPVPGALGNQYDVFGLLSYEIDVWGRICRLSEAAKADFLAAEESRRAVYITLLANVATTYFDLLALDAQLRIARQTYESRTNSLRLTEIKFHKGEGIVSELDVRQAETQVHTARSAIASIERSIAITQNALSFLLGSNPRSIERGKPLEEQSFPSEIPAGLPSDLLLRRPDIASAEQHLISANANIGAARAAFFPAISLTAALGLQSVELENLFDAGVSRAWNFAPQVAGPIFNAGRIRAGVESARAARAAAVAQYEQTIQNAFREVEDALVSRLKLKEQLDADAANVMAERKRLELSRLRYENGISSYSDVLDAERFLFNAELSLVQTRNDYLAAHAQLYKTLGGGWPAKSGE